MRLYLAAPNAQSSRNGGAEHRRDRQLCRGGYRLPRVGQTDPFVQDGQTGQRREQKVINMGSSAPGSQLRVFGMNPLWI